MNPTRTVQSFDALARRIDALLPQTQCTRCGYPACLDYARAIARNEAAINQCPPGGAAGIGELALLLGRPFEPLNPLNGIEAPARIALIDEDVCIGCTKCIQACPVDAIVGAAKMMHTILTDECSGCDLCIPACPVDCITMIDPFGEAVPATARAAQYRRRFEARNARLERERAEHAAALAARKAALRTGTGAASAVLEALARAKARKAETRAARETTTAGSSAYHAKLQSAPGPARRAQESPERQRDNAARHGQSPNEDAEGGAEST